MIRLFSIPMRMRFGRVERRALIEGTCGWGEFSPFPEHPALPCACGLATVAPLRGDVAAAALPALPFACGLATVAPLRGDVAAASLPALPFVCGLATVAPLGGDVAAAALPALPFACGPATAAPFRGDVVAAPLLPVVGAVPVRRPSPGPAALARYAPRGPEAGWVLDRMAVADRLGWPAV